MDTKGFGVVSGGLGCGGGSRSETYNLELDRDNTEVEHLNRGPNEEVRLERRHVNVLELADDCAPSTALCDCHECEETTETWEIVSLWGIGLPLQIGYVPTGANRS